jgi:WD40 repeat protein
MSHDGRHVAAGDWYGNIRIHDIESENLDEIKVIEAHENEVLSLDYTRQIDSKTAILESNYNTEEAYLLASGSRDSLV